MHFLEAGAGPPIVFLHGNPTSSELWRPVIPPVAPFGRCVAPDLIGMGRSAKPDVAYRFSDHARFLDGFIDALKLDDVVLVAHDWGVALAADLIARRPCLVRGFAFAEGRLEPVPGWSAFDEGGRALFQVFRTPGEGERLIIEENMMIEVILQAGTVRPLSPAELDAYRAPFRDPLSRRPLLQWTREIPIGGEPADVARTMAAAYAALRASPIPKLALFGAPGTLIGQDELERWLRELPDFSVRNVGTGGHFLPHDRAAEIGEALADWLRSLV